MKDKSRCPEEQYILEDGTRVQLRLGGATSRAKGVPGEPTVDIQPPEGAGKQWKIHVK